MNARQPLNRKTATAINAIGKLLIDAGNTGMSRAAIARERKASRSHISQLIAPFIGDDKCFKLNQYDEPVVNMQQWNETTGQFKERALRSGTKLRAEIKAARAINAENSITIDPKTKLIMVFLSKALPRIASNELVMELYDKINKVGAAEITKEQRVVKHLVNTIYRMSKIDVNTDPSDMVDKVIKDLGLTPLPR